jgi:hypothetical protein
MNPLSVWNISAESYPADGGIEDKIKYFLRWGILAPSAHNSQPWSVKINQSNITVGISKERLLVHGDPIMRQTLISIGALISNTVKAAECFGFNVVITLLPDGFSIKNDIAILQFTPPVENILSPINEVELDTIRTRMVNRGDFSSKKIPNSVIESLTRSFNTENIQLLVCEEPEEINRASNLVYEATRFAMDGTSFRNELYQYLIEDDINKVGIPLNTSNISNKKLLEENPDLLAEKDRATFRSCAAIALIASTTDDYETWISSGIYMENLALNLTSLGISWSVAAGPIEAPGSYGKLKQIFKTDLRPQFFFRLGYSTKDFPHSPRLDIDEIII